VSAAIVTLAAAPSPPRYWCARLALVAFRNHPGSELVLDGRPVCLFGPNGAGKTNILEALTLLAPGRGLRGASLMDLAQGGEEGAADRARPWVVSADLELDAARFTVGVGAERAPEGGLKRIARLDGRAAVSGDLARAARIAWVTPNMDRLFSGPPGDRRRFLDRLVLGRAPEHGLQAAAYERALKERQRLLGEGRFDPAWLTGLEREMAAHGAALAAARVETVRALAETIAARPVGAFPKAVLSLEGDLEAAFLRDEPSGDVEDRFLVSLKTNRGRDAAAGRALEGPHRADLKVRHGPKDMPAELCSTGEQKALLLGLVLAHARALADDAASGPSLLLLDEAAAHLDGARRGALYEELLSLPGQSWLTGTDASLFDAFGARAQMLEVRDGRVLG
jgi:DNA replication and repair protein RecF